MTDPGRPIIWPYVVAGTFVVIQIICWIVLPTHPPANVNRGYLGLLFFPIFAAAVIAISTFMRNRRARR